MKTNLGLEYNKRVYINLSSNPMGNENYRNDNVRLYELLINTKLKDLESEQLDLSKKGIPNYHSFTLTTAGQGLLLGIGNEHGTGVEYKSVNYDKGKKKIKKKETHEFKMGFQFDHTTGIPVITGHTLKGRLRSFFPIAYRNKKKRDAVTKRLIADIEECFNKKFSETSVNELQNAIFEGKDEKGNNIPVLKRDDFFGAYPSKSFVNSYIYAIPKKEYNQNGRVRYKPQKINIESGTFLFDDTLAHHKHPLQDPNPINFLKILPDVEIKFQFKLFNSGGLKAKEKEKLFEFLLQKYGIGAKTASGYGQFKKNDTEISNENGFVNFHNFSPIEIEDNSESHYKPLIEKNTKETIEVKQGDNWVELNTLKQGSVIAGTVISYNSGNAKIRLHIKDKEIVLGLQGKFTEKETLKLIVKETSGSIKKGNYTITRVMVSNR